MSTLIVRNSRQSAFLSQSWSITKPRGESRFQPYKKQRAGCLALSNEQQLYFSSATAWKKTEGLRPTPPSSSPKNRQDELVRSGIELYPRLKNRMQPSHENGLLDYDKPSSLTIVDFLNKHNGLESGETREDDGNLTVNGRIISIRKNGSKLAFVDIIQEVGSRKLQIMLNLSDLKDTDRPTFAAHIQLIRRGDVISVTGVPYCTTSGELSLRARYLPQLTAPCLHSIPLTVTQKDRSSESELLDKHVEMLADGSHVQTLVTRSRILRAMRGFFEKHGFEEVQTPILAAVAGGANARPFETTATEFANRKLSLRIAPELWLKRLILGGMSRIYEIGPSFRNEGLDKTHNPEFTTCEFYAAYHTLSDLKMMTERLLRDVYATVHKVSDQPSFPDPDLDEISHSSEALPEIDFIPALNACLASPLPNLASPQARSKVFGILQENEIPIPANPTLPRLLDKLCSHYLEPRCTIPTWITNIPECLSPLAKSFIHPTAPNSQPVAARAELFVKNYEIVNCYEEENSPYEQRRKLVEQQRYAGLIDKDLTGQMQQSHDDEAMKVDEDYLRALEWGLPPTGGWGCGIDRLAMLFTQKDRIGDVLSFGNLRAVTRGAERWTEKDDKAGQQTNQS